MLRLLEIFWGKNSSPIFSELVRARASHPYILLVGTIKLCNFHYQHFLLRPFLSKIFAGPFHRAKMIEQGKTINIQTVNWDIFFAFRFLTSRDKAFKRVVNDTSIFRLELPNRTTGLNSKTAPESKCPGMDTNHFLIYPLLLCKNNKGN